MFKTGIDSKTIQIKQETTILPGGGGCRTISYHDR